MRQQLLFLPQVWSFVGQKGFDLTYWPPSWLAKLPCSKNNRESELISETHHFNQRCNPLSSGFVAAIGEKATQTNEIKDEKWAN